MDIKKYLSEVRSEMNKVSWPSKQKTIKDSIAVIAASIAMALFIAGADMLFQNLSGFIISK
jgi:preprotein translocase subunit SecE